MREAAWPAKAASATQYPHFFHLGYELTGERGKRPSRLKHHGLARSLISHITDIGLADQFPLRFERAMQFQRLFAIDRKEHTSGLQSLMRISYAVFCLKKKNCTQQHQQKQQTVK